MKNNSFEEHFLISNGMVHMAYRADSISDIVCRYSVEGYETLSYDFVQTFDEILPHIPKRMPVVLEISGCSFSEEEKKLVERTIWNHYHMRLSGIRQENRSMFIKMCWFAICFISSAILLFLVNDKTENVLIQFAYLPFWFFGYRVLTYLVLNLVPQIKDTIRHEQLAGMKVFFSDGSPLNEVPEEKVDNYRSEFIKNIKKREYADIRKMVGFYLIEADGSASITCRVSGLDDVIRRNCVSGYEMLNTELEAYIDQQLPYVPDKAKLKLEICGTDFSDAEKKIIAGASADFFAFRYESARKEVMASHKRILWFTIFMAAASVLLLFTENKADKALLEFITMIFWFIGDYLIEFVLLGLTGAMKNLKRIKNFAKAEVKIQ